MFSGRRVALIAVCATVVWFIFVVLFWASQPLSDSVPVGVDYTSKPAVFVSASARCNALLDSAAQDSSQLPALKAQPPGAPKLAFQRDPCALVRSQGRLVLALDTAVVLAVVLGAVWFVYWRPRTLPVESAPTGGGLVGA